MIDDICCRDNDVAWDILVKGEKRGALMFFVLAVVEH